MKPCPESGATGERNEGIVSPSKPHKNVLDGRRAALLVIDVQERFRPAIAEFPSMAAACGRLVRAFRLLDLPVLITEQYPKGLGPTAPEVLDAFGPETFKVPEKTAFSALRCAGLPERLAASGARSVLVCGIEAHVCVNQSVHDLLAAGYEVHVAVDAVQSRRALDREMALRKMERSGAVLTTCEAAAFEIMADSKHPRFKEVQGLFK